MAVDPDPDDFAALAELAEIFGELVEALNAGESANLSAEGIVEVAGRCLPRSKGVALVVVDDHGTATLAATSDVGERIGRIRDELGQGPALDVLETNDLVVCDNLPEDERWLDFGRRVVAETGVRSMVSYRLYLARNCRAALTFYSDWPYAFDELAICTGAIFAAYCSLALVSSHVLREQVSTARSAEVHREIGVAVGILMHAQGLDTSAAYARLHHSARRLRTSLPEVAGYVREHRTLPA